jgi:hypothetical protein
VEPLDLSFKGSRDYIQGPDMVDAVGDCLAREYGADRIRQVTFTINRIARRALQLELRGRTPDERKIGSVRFSLDGRAEVASLIEIDRPVTLRRDYPEERIVERCRFDLTRQTCEITAPLEFTTTEHLVAMNKALHQRCFPAASGRWMFVKLEAPAYPSRSCEGPLLVRLVRHFGDKLTKSETFDGGHSPGHIFFSLMPA